MRLRTRRGPRGGYSATAGLHFDDEEFESRIVWIWTMARSGSTWLLQMLAHPLKLDWSQDSEDPLGFLAPPTWQGTVDAIPVDTTFVDGGGAEQDPRQMWSAIVEATRATLDALSALEG